MKRKITLSQARSCNAVGVHLKCRCGHSVDIAIEAMVTRVGADTSLSDIEERAICNECGKKGGIQARPIYHHTGTLRGPEIFAPKTQKPAGGAETAKSGYSPADI